MAFSVPNVTVFTLATKTISGLLAALYAHWEPSGASTKFTASLPTGAPDGASSFLITPDDGGENWQLNFRFASGENANLAIDPNGSITDSSNPSASASAAWSGELSSLWYDISELNGKVAIIEFDDAIFVLMSGTYDDSYPTAIHAGKVLTPLWSSDTSNGLTGLGYFGRVPRIVTSLQTSYLWSSGVSHPSFSSNYMKMQYGNTEAEWSSQGYFMRDAYPTQAEVTLGSSVPAIPIVLARSVETNRPVGVLKYIYNWWIPHTPTTRIEDGTGVKFLHIWYSKVLEKMIIPWDDSTLP